MVRGATNWSGDDRCRWFDDHFPDARSSKMESSRTKDGEKYFQPSLARTASGNFIPAKVLMHDDYCKKCHPGIYDDWFHSAHRFSSFNNPAYLYAIRETRAAVTQRDGNRSGFALVRRLPRSCSVF